jgi:hypothetical protein
LEEREKNMPATDSNCDVFTGGRADFPDVAMPAPAGFHETSEEDAGR